MAERKDKAPDPQAVEAEERKPSAVESDSDVTTGVELEQAPAPPAAAEGETKGAAELGQWVVYTVSEGVEYPAIITEPKHMRVPLFDENGEPRPPVQALTAFPPMAAPIFVTAVAGDGPGTWH